MEPVIDHIEITVKDMAKAVIFYDRLLPLLGYDLSHRSSTFIEGHDKQVVSYEHPRLGFAITSPAGYYAIYFKDPDGIKYEVVCCEKAAST
jgi:catechol 2,3-dioxygenase-like lactoylglutathione lyase family enzyme